MQTHAALSESILSRIAAFSELAPIAGAHHERLNGKGYPRGLKGAEICLETCIITARGYFRCVDSRPALSRGDAGHQGARDHGRDGRHTDRCGLF